MERKYKQKGYHESGAGRDEKKNKEHRPAEPRPRQDQLGPRTPRMVGSVSRARCSNCGTVLMPGFDPNGQCPKCGLEMHSCKQCRHFDTGAQFECTQPIPERITKKDAEIGRLVIGDNQIEVAVIVHVADGEIVGQMACGKG